MSSENPYQSPGTTDDRPAFELHGHHVPFIIAVVCGVALAVLFTMRPRLSEPDTTFVRICIVAGLPEVPGFGQGFALLRVAWSIVSLQGFKQQLLYTSWATVRDAQVSGPPDAAQIDDLRLVLPPVERRRTTGVGFGQYRV
ncbi:MAG TPA: hypothetical protein VHC22_20320 [Pirellulales bacterium]|nr:hypothetical protein [Pirellulales bacterium]